MERETIEGEDVEDVGKDDEDLEAVKLMPLAFASIYPRMSVTDTRLKRACSS